MCHSKGVRVSWCGCMCITHITMRVCVCYSVEHKYVTEQGIRVMVWIVYMLWCCTHMSVCTHASLCDMYTFYSIAHSGKGMDAHVSGWGCVCVMM